MYDIDYQNLSIVKVSDASNSVAKSVALNIAGDWAPISGQISDVFIEKQKTFYGDIEPYFKNADLNIANLETVIDAKQRNHRKGASKLIDSPEVLSSLVSINMHLLCLANNHIMDNGAEGVRQTLHHLKERKLSFVGAGLSRQEIYSPYFFEKDGQKIAIINTAEGEEANEKYNNNCGASDIESYHIIDQIRECKNKGYFTILIAHAGAEFIPVPPPHIRDLYRTFAAEGADMVVGHHPHVPQGLEIYQDTPIFYSIGHFGIFRRHSSRKMEKVGFIINFTIVNQQIETLNMVPYQISASGLQELRGTTLDSFRVMIKKSSDYIQNQTMLSQVWKEYIFFRYPLLELKDIVSSYRFDDIASYVQQVNLMVQFSRRLMYLPRMAINKFEHADYLKEFGCVKKLTWRDKFFLAQKNMLYLPNRIANKAFSVLRKIKKSFS